LHFNVRRWASFVRCGRTCTAVLRFGPHKEGRPRGAPPLQRLPIFLTLSGPDAAAGQTPERRYQEGARKPVPAPAPRSKLRSATHPPLANLPSLLLAPLRQSASGRPVHPTGTGPFLPPNPLGSCRCS